EKLLLLLHAGKFRIVGHGRNRLQLVYADDLAWAVAEAAERPELDGAEFICTYRDPISMNDLVRLSAAALGRPAPRLHVPVAVPRVAGPFLEGLESVGIVKGEPLATHEKIAMIPTDRAYDISRLQNLLGWTPPTGYAEGLARTVAAL